MAFNISRRSFFGVAGIVGAAALSGCAGGASSSATAASASKAASLTVGTLATEDLLPLWVAKQDGLLDKGALTVDIVTFQSATELIAGVASGEVDLAMTDIMVTASMFANGVDVSMEWVTLGATPDQGRFGIMVGPNSNIASLTDLADVPIGVGSNTILEYVMDKLLESAGVPDSQIKVEELQKLPVRYQAMVSGEVAAAALPGTLLALGEASGCKLVADDTKGENLSQSVMIARSDALKDPAKAASVEALRSIWDESAQQVNSSPEKYRSVLVANANLPSEIADTYPISAYPKAQLPTNAMVDPVLSWMEKKVYLEVPLAYDQATGQFSKA